MSGFVNLHNHSSYSLLDGFSQVDLMASTAAAYGQTHLALTDHGNCDNALNFMYACEKHNIKPIYGCEFYIVEDAKVKEKGEKRSHLIALAKNEIGFQNILKMITKSNLEYSFYRPRIDPELLLENSEGLIITSACSASFLRHGWGRDMFEALKDKQDEDLYLEIMPHLLKDQLEVNELVISLQKKYGNKIISTADSHYCLPEHAICQEVVLAVQSNKKWNDPARWKFDGDSFYLMSRRDMSKEYMNQNQLDREIYMEAMANTMEIAEKIEFHKIAQKSVSLPKIAVVGEENDFEYLERECWKKLKEQSFANNKIYCERLEEELALIKEKKFERYFLLLKDLFDWCRDENIFVGPGRGSSAGSLVCYLMEITSVDPIKHNLLFFRFLSPERIDLPDVDSDISHIDRYKVRQRLEELYGKNSVAGVSTFSVMRGRAALRDCGRVFEVPLSDINKACSVIEKKIGEDEGNEHTIETALTNFDDGKAFYEKYPQVSDLAIQIEGTERNRGVHAAAIVVADNDLTDGTRCSLVLGKEKENTINWDKNIIEHFGLIKMDILGLKMLSVLKYAAELVENNYGIKINFKKVPLDDKKCYTEMSKGNTTGCFQLGSTNIKKFCKQLGIDDFDTLVAATSLYRPGPLGGGNTDSYVKRKRGEESVPQIHPILDEITKDTYGVIVYQETVMMIMYRLAGMDWKDVDKVRKLVAKSKGEEALRKYEEMFVQGCVNNKTLREDQATSLWNDIVSFGKYGFNLSHAVSYSYITVWDMFLKVYYPVEFITALLTYGTDDDDTRDEYVEEAFRLGIEIRPPKIGISSAAEYRIHDGRIYLPFSSIKGVGEKTAKGFEKLGKNNKKGFSSKEEKSPVSMRFLNILEKIGAYEDKELTDEEADEVGKFLSISLVKNKLFKFKRLINLISSTLNISLVKNININEIDGEYRYYFGIITELNLTTRNGKSGKYNVATVSFKDGTGDCKINFDGELYKNKSYNIEHCEGEIIIIKANSPKRAGSLIASEAWFQEEIMSGDLTDLYLGLAENRRYKPEGVLECEDCDIRKQCRRVVEPKMGRYNMMIIGESGADNNDALWRELKKYDFVQRDFYTTSVIKCDYPTKSITRKDTDNCAKWLDDEIENVKPFIVLSIGNTGIKYFTDDDTGIQSKNGSCEWNERYGCWVLYCLSSSSTYYEQNIKPFRETIKIFSEKIKNLGLIAF